MADAIQELAELLARLPEIGHRTALRLTFHLLRANPEYLRRLGDTVSSIRDRVRECSRCRNWTESDPCAICADPRRDAGLLCVVATVPDLSAIEESGAFRGRYHVLHGLLSPLDGVGPDDLGVDRLRERVAAGGVSEVIVATPPSMNGEVTATLVRKTLEGLPVRLSRIASGIPHGGELEYTDKTTLSRAIAHRTVIE